MSTAVHGLAGVVSSSAAMILTYPLLTIATKQQVRKDNGSMIAYLTDPKNLHSLYTGVGPAVFGTAYSMGIYFYTYEWMKKYLYKIQQRQMNTFENLLVAFIAGVINTTLSAPIWRITTRIQAKNGTANRESAFTTFKAILAEGGVKSFWNGWIASIILCINPAIQWMVYEQLSKLWIAALKRKDPTRTQFLSPTTIFFLGAVAKIVATLITYPYIMVKSRMQAETGKGPKRLGSVDEEQLQFRYNGIVDAFIKICKKDGFLGLYAGLNSKLIQSVLNSAFMFLFKEQFIMISAAILKVLTKKTVTQ